MRLGFGKNSGKFDVAIDSNPIQHRRFSLPKMIIYSDYITLRNSYLVKITMVT